MVFEFGIPPQQDWFEEIWRKREEEIYPALFGSLPDTVIPLPIETIRAILGYEAEVDEAWLHYAVVEVAPNEKHNDWIYVTSAFSQPWKAESQAELDPDGSSGYGYEMLIRTPERANWAVDVLHRLGAYQLGVYHEKMKGKLFGWHDWMPLNGPISPDYPTSAVRGMFITHPRDFEAHFELPSGRVNFLQIVGITGPELAYGLFKGFDRLEDLLFEAGAAPTTNPARKTIELPQEFPLPVQLAGRF
jgi:hypothetical protein